MVVADPVKTISLRIPVSIYEDIEDDLEAVAREVKKKRGGGHNSENAALVALIQEAVEARRAQGGNASTGDVGPSNGLDEPPKKAASQRRRR